MGNQSYHIGRLISIFLFFLQGTIAIIKVLMDPNLPLHVAAIFFIVWLLSLWEISRMTDERGVSNYAFCVFTCLSSLFFAVVLTYIYKSLILLVIVFMIQCVAVICFGQKKSAIVIGTGMLLSLGMVGLTDILGLSHIVTRIDWTVSVLGTVIAIWVTLTVITMFKEEKRSFEEQKRSVDDMLRIVEVMCDEARAGTKSKSEFLSNMSHEIRTPINSILGMNEMILRESKDDAITEYATNVDHSGKMLLALINDILDFSKIDAGKMELSYAEYRLSVLLNDLINMLSNRMEEKGLEFHVQVDPNTPECMIGDERRLKQIIMNLLTNAVKYTDHGSVTLKVYPEQRTKSSNVRLCVEVIDTGRGIKLADQEHLFDAFSRADSRKNKNIEGTGLGLAIAHNFTELMNGEIGVESEYGKGSDFYIKIPQITTSNTVIGDYSEQIQLKKRKEKEYEPLFIAPDAKILIVDDNEMNLTVATYLLKHNQVQITKATGGWQAIEALRQDKYDLVLLDHMMPELDGVDTLKIMRAEGILDGAPVVALTANAIAGSRDMYMVYGFDDYLSKPIAGIDLERCMLKWLPEKKILERKDG